jgi:hypothetical protein
VLARLAAAVTLPGHVCVSTGPDTFYSPAGKLILPRVDIVIISDLPRVRQDSSLAEDVL